MEILQTRVFSDWLEGLRDKMAVKRIKQRVLRLEIGLFGDSKAIGDGVSELRIDHGPGYRVYFTRQGEILVLLLCGGDKSSKAGTLTARRA